MKVSVEMGDGEGIDLVYCPHDNNNLTIIGFSKGEIQIRDTKSLKLLFTYQADCSIQSFKQLKWIQSHESGFLFFTVDSGNSVMAYAQAFKFDMEDSLAFVVMGDVIELTKESSTQQVKSSCGTMSIFETQYREDRIIGIQTEPNELMLIDVYQTVERMEIAKQSYKVLRDWINAPNPGESHLVGIACVSNKIIMIHKFGLVAYNHVKNKLEDWDYPEEQILWKVDFETAIVDGYPVFNEGYEAELVLAQGNNILRVNPEDGQVKDTISHKLGTDRPILKIARSDC